MTSKSLTIEVTCPAWCDESPRQHFGDGMLYHKHTVGKVAATLGDGQSDGDTVAQVEVTIERYDVVAEAGVELGPVVLRLGGDEQYPVVAARELAGLLLAAADAVSPGCDDE